MSEIRIGDIHDIHDPDGPDACRTCGAPARLIATLPAPTGELEPAGVIFHCPNCHQQIFVQPRIQRIEVEGDQVKNMVGAVVKQIDNLVVIFEKVIVLHDCGAR